MRIVRLLLIAIFVAVAVPGCAAAAPDGTGAAVRSGPFVVTEVYDGDTVVVDIEGRATEVRLIGVDTPETVHPDKPVQFYGPEASAFTKRTLNGTRVWLELDDPGRPGGAIDAYGRTLAYIITPDGRNFNLELVRLGYGRAYTRFPFKYKKEFRAAEQEARSQGRGLWAKALRDALQDPEARGRIIGNKRSRLYHVPGQHSYLSTAKWNRIYFNTEDEARRAGYRKAGN